MTVSVRCECEKCVLHERVEVMSGSSGRNERWSDWVREQERKRDAERKLS
jgi:hypothetical protein